MAKVGIIADEVLQKHHLQQVINQAGYSVVACLAPEKVDLNKLNDGGVSMWVVDLQRVDQYQQLLDDLLDCDTLPIIYADGEIPPRNDENYPKWERRLLEKMASIAAPESHKNAEVLVDLSHLDAPKAHNVITLDESFQFKTKTDIGQIWVVCASLGGPQAVKAFFDCLPATIPVAFVYGQHIDQSGLAALENTIGRHSELTFKIATAQSQLQNGEVLIAPIDNEIQFRMNHGVHVIDEQWRGAYAPCLDQLLENISVQFNQQANCIIFSGMDNDSTLGAQIIHTNGGLVWGQSKQSCIQSSMPDQAYETGVMSLRDTPQMLARQLIEHIKSSVTEQKAEIS
ncbi:chemotaxis protein CheB [Marinicellulosiphila megalodicopiae]|uniref:chemotaxis protein CheB n=1 Tax=Marinicellulosiphila megalodicopiae TaxID=2724896 RepID=UPI003BB0DB9B